MCANCVAQGAVYVGGALTALQAMAHRAKAKRWSADDASDGAEPTDHPRRTASTAEASSSSGETVGTAASPSAESS